MAYIAGVDIGNNTTEVAIAEVKGKGDARFLSSAMVRTVGIKGDSDQCDGNYRGPGPGPEAFGYPAERPQQGPA